MKRIRAAAVQIAPDYTKGLGTVDRVCDAIDRAAAQGVELAVFPETFIPRTSPVKFLLRGHSADVHRQGPHAAL